MSDLWTAFWFQAGSDVHLGVVRIAFFTWLLVNVRWKRVLQLTEVYKRAPSFWRPMSFYRHVPEYVLTFLADNMRLLTVGWYVALFLAITGFLFPLGGLLIVLLSMVLLGYDLQFGFVRHYMCAVPFMALILSFAPADPYCLLPLVDLSPPAAGFYWPLQLARVLIAFMFCAAGLAKLRYSGIQWITSEQFSSILKLHVMDYAYDAPRDPRLALWLIGHPRISRFVAMATIGVELFYPMALFDWRFAIVIVPASILMLIGIRMTMGRPMFLPLAAMSVLAWFPFMRIVDERGPLLAAACLMAALTVLQSLPIWHQSRSVPV